MIASVSALTLALLTCLSIDFSNPLLPGVVRFNDSESVYAVRAERPRTAERSAVAGLFPALAPRLPHRVVAPLRPALGGLEGPRLAPAGVRPRGLPSTARAMPALAAGEDH
jgi:hypothetical protein